MQDLQTTLVILVIMTFCGILIAGSTNKVVVYFDTNDLFISFMPWGSLFIGMLLVNVYHHGNETLDYDNLSFMQSLFFYLSVAASIVFLAWSIKLSIMHNQSIGIGLVVGLFKILSSLLGVVVILGQISSILDRKSSLKDAFVAVFIIGMLVWLGKKLINGEQVYISKGWPLPYPES